MKCCPWKLVTQFQLGNYYSSVSWSVKDFPRFQLGQPESPLSPAQVDLGCRLHRQPSWLRLWLSSGSTTEPFQLPACKKGKKTNEYRANRWLEGINWYIFIKTQAAYLLLLCTPPCDSMHLCRCRRKDGYQGWCTIHCQSPQTLPDRCKIFVITALWWLSKMMESVARTEEFAWLLWKLNPQSFSIILMQGFKSRVRKNVIIDMALVTYFQLHET